MLTMLEQLAPDRCPVDTAADIYRASDRYSSDAVTWLADNLDRYPSLIEIAEALYDGSDRFHTVVDDFICGEVEL